MSFNFSEKLYLSVERQRARAGSKWPICLVRLHRIQVGPADGID